MSFQRGCWSTCSTPSGYASAAELLMGRCLQMTLPITISQLQLSQPDLFSVKEKENKAKECPENN